MPFAEYKDFNSCVSQNKDIRDEISRRNNR